MDQRHWSSGIGGFCVEMLIAAIMVYVAVQLIEAVFWWLIGIVIVLGFCAVLVKWIRHQNEYW